MRAKRADARVEPGAESTAKQIFAFIITRTAPTVKHIPDDRSDEPTRIAAETHSRQAGAADPVLAAWLCVAAVSLVLAMRGMFI